MPAAEYTCACGHLLDQHERPTSPREPWGECRAIVQVDGHTQRCDCREAWPVEDPE